MFTISTSLCWKAELLQGPELQGRLSGERAGLSRLATHRKWKWLWKHSCGDPWRPRGGLRVLTEFQRPLLTHLAYRLLTHIFFFVCLVLFLFFCSIHIFYQRPLGKTITHDKKICHTQCSAVPPYWRSTSRKLPFLYLKHYFSVRRACKLTVTFLNLFSAVPSIFL